MAGTVTFSADWLQYGALGLLAIVLGTIGIALRAILKRVAEWGDQIVKRALAFFDRLEEVMVKIGNTVTQSEAAAIQRHQDTRDRIEAMGQALFRKLDEEIGATRHAIATPLQVLAFAVNDLRAARGLKEVKIDQPLRGTEG